MASSKKGEQEVGNGTEKRMTVSAVILEALSESGENVAVTFSDLQRAVALARNVEKGKRVRIWKTIETLIASGKVVRLDRGLFALAG